MEEWAAERPAALAVAGEGRRLSYGQLNGEANRLAHHLRSLGVGAETLVALLFPRTPDAVVAALAVLKAGGCYLPLDTAYPDDRLAFTLEDSKALLLLGPRGLLEARPALGAAGAVPLALEELAPALAAAPDSNLTPVAGLGHLAYVIYTSGSSGRPKGVEIEHRGLVNLIAWHRAELGVGPADRATRIAGSAFDASVWEIWSTLATGASLHLPPEELLLNPEALAAWLEAEGITFSFLPTPLAEAVLRLPGAEGSLLRGLRTLAAGGDRLHLRPSPGAPYRLVNLYGPTENSVVSTAGFIAPAPAETPAALPSIGQPIAGVSALVAGSGLEPRAEGEEGELLLGGLGLARGYRGRADLTAERFVPDPSAGSPGARLYRSGDLVRSLPGGEIDFIGRVDFQVKVRGFRIELGEIEAALRLHPAVREAVVLALDGGEGEKRLAGYAVPEETADSARLAADLQTFLGERLPEYMVPALWVVLDRMPLTPNGKVDRRALPPPDFSSREHRPAVSAAEHLVAAAFCEVLGLERAGLDTDFFVQGGHSLRATQVASRLRAARGVEVPARVLYDHPTVERLAAWLDGESGTASDEGWSLRPVPRPEGEIWEFPASFAQRRLWLMDLFEPGSTVYNTPFALELAGPLSLPALGGALATLFRRHEALRTTFRDEDGEVLQVVARQVAVPLPLVDLSALAPAGAEREAERLIDGEARRPFDLRWGPVFRASLLRLAAESHILLAGLHHIVSDDWSIYLLTADLAALYRAGLEGAAPALPPLPVQYADFSVWQHEWLRGEPLARQLAWWRAHLRPPLPLLDLPTDRPRPARQTFAGGRLRRPLAGPALAAIRSLTARADASPFMVLLSAWFTLLARHAGVEEVATGSPIANRHRLEVERLIGLFVNTLVLRADLEGAPALPEVVARVRETLLAAYSHQDLPFDRLVEDLAPERDLARNALVDVFVVYANAPKPPSALAPGLSLGVREIENGGAKVDLTLFLEEEPDGGILGIWEYNSRLFDEATVARMAGHLDQLLAAGAAPDSPAYTALPLLSAAERSELVRLAPGPEARDLPDALLHQLFFAQAARTPEATALVAGEERLTYRALAARVVALAAHLRSLGLGPEEGVAIFLERGTNLVVSLLAAMASGGYYVPLDPRYPADRVEFMIGDSGCRAVLTQSSLAARLPAVGATVLHLDREPVDRPGESPSSTAPAAAAGVLLADPANLAYLIYTSGSTGKPKAVAIAHRSAVAMVRWALDAFTPAELAGVLAATSITFDLSVFEIFVPLACGGTVIVADDALALPRLPAAGEVTLVNTVPSALTELLRMEALPVGVATVNLAGEALPRTLADAIHARPGVERLYNLYGPSEDTTYSTFALVERGTERPPAIGRPIAGSSGWITGRDGSLQPLGVPGELLLGGAGLARGYLHRPELTAERFVPDPFGAVPGSRLYRTGDLVRLRPGGQLDYLGRLDHQVKVRGFRIELGEIERALVELAGMESAVVLALEHPARGLELVAFAVPGGAGARSAAEIREALRSRLPEFMIPARFRPLDALPLTPNGKIDRKALAALGRTAEGMEAGAAAGPLQLEGPIEEKVAAIFLAVLGIETIGAGDSFFEAGGSSLVATRVLARVRKAFGVDLDLRVLFEQPTVRGLAARIVREMEAGGDPASAPLVAARRPLASAPLSFAQERFWFLAQLDPASTLYSIPLVLHLAGPLDPGALAAALASLAERHEVLRTTFGALTGQPSQQIGPAGPMPLALSDLSRLGAGAAGEAGRLALVEARRPFDLEREPPFRCQLLRLGAEEHRLLVTLHHIAADGRSIEVLLHDLRELYAAAVAGRASRLPALAVQVADFALWQRRRWSAEALEQGAARERERLAGAPQRLELPADRQREGAGAKPVPHGNPGDTWLEPLAAPAGVAVENLARAAGGTPFMVFLAALHVLLGRICGVDDLLVGSPAGGRTRSETEELIGLFLNTLVLRGRLSGRDPFSAHLAAVREDVLAAIGQQDLPFEKLVEAIAPERQLARNPLFQVLFVFQGRRMADLELAPGTSLHLAETLSNQAKFDLKLVIERRDEGYVAAWEYSTLVFEAETVRRLARSFAELVAAFAANPELRLDEVPLWTAAERQVLLADWDRPAPAPPATFPEFFEGWAARTPEAVAVEDESGAATYGELAARAENLARRIAGCLEIGEAGPEPVVALCFPRSIGVVAALLGAMKAGAAYLALDPELPDERLAYQLRDSGAAVLVGDGAARERFGALVPAFLEVGLDGTGSAKEDGPEASASLRSRYPGRLAYLLYTSGSTGAPKGVLVEHGQLASYLAGILQAMDRAGLAAPARFAMVSTFAADLGHTVLFPALATGGTLAVVAQERVLDPDRLADRFTAQPADVLKIVPSHLAALLAGDRPERVLPRRLLVLGGEGAPEALLEQIRHFAPECRVLNHYGPTETTVGVLAFPTWEEDCAGTGILPLGRPLGRSRAAVVDAWGDLAPAGVPGELLIGGPQVSRGYLGRPELTAERFVPDPYGGFGARLYRTGDRAVRRRGGRIEFLGRIDSQVKIRGFRIEPGEVEAALRSIAGVDEAVVVARKDLGPEPTLVAYLVRRGEESGIGAGPEGERIGEILRRRLPEAMVPAHFVFLAALPLTANGKVSRAALPPPRAQAAEEGEGDRSLSPTEWAVAEAFAKVLGRDGVTAGSDFFRLGGHSLAATRTVIRLRRTLGIEIELRSLFDHPTVEKLARHLDATASARRTETGDPGAGPRAAIVPVSLSQQRIWLLGLLTPGSALFNMPLRYRVEGPLSVPLLKASLARLAERHEALRTLFTVEDGEPVLVLDRPAAVPFLAVDLSTLDAETARREGEAVAQRMAMTPFELEMHPLVRAAAVLGPAGEGELVLTLHHLISDGWSNGILMRELAHFYGALERAEGRPALSPLPPLHRQYSDFALWQRRRLQGELLERQVEFWRTELGSSLEPLELPTDRPRRATASYGGSYELLPLRAGLLAATEELGLRLNGTLFVTLLAAFEALLARETGRELFTVGLPVANRDAFDGEGIVGCFVNTLVARAEVRGSGSFADLVGRVRETLLAALGHQDIPFEALVDELAPERDLARPPLCQVLFTASGDERMSVALGERTRLHLLPSHSETAKMEIVLNVTTGGDAPAAAIEYRRDLWDPASIRRLVARFEHLLAAVVAAPDSALDRLSLLAEAERQQLAHEWSGAPLSPRPEGGIGSGPGSIVGKFAAWVERQPAAPALRDGEIHLTYGELDERSSLLAAALLATGLDPAGREPFVGVCLERSAAHAVALLAVLKAGGVYLPLDPGLRPERLEALVADARPAIVVTAEFPPGARGDSLPPALRGIPALRVEANGSVSAPAELGAAWDMGGSGGFGARGGIGARGAGEPLRCRVGGGHLACVVHASEGLEDWGASPAAGEPLAHLFDHGALTARLVALAADLAIGSGDTVLALHPPGGSAGLLEMLLPLAAGGRIEIARGGVLAEPARLRALVAGRDGRDGGRTLARLAGAARAELFSGGWRAPLGFRAVLFGVRSSSGSPLPGSLWRILAPSGGLAPLGASGSLHLGGEGMARGILGRADRTADLFRPDPWAGTGGVAPGARLFRTSQSARFERDGRLGLVGRAGGRARVRGHLVDLTEIEETLLRAPGVLQAAVAAETGQAGEIRLAAYVVAATGAFDLAEVQRFVRGEQPAHPTPSACLALEALPLTPEGELDFAALAASAPAFPESDLSGDGYAAPRTEIEQTLASVWAEVLGYERIGLRQSFWELGGHSLLAAKVLARVAKAFEVDLPFDTLFKHPHLEDFALVVAERLLSGDLEDEEADLPLVAR